ncbi:hypothetical protein GN956_G24623 [Arapaima gigas]
MLTHGWSMVDLMVGRQFSFPAASSMSFARCCACGRSEWLDHQSLGMMVLDDTFDQPVLGSTRLGQRRRDLKDRRLLLSPLLRWIRLREQTQKSIYKRR